VAFSFTRSLRLAATLLIGLGYVGGASAQVLGLFYAEFLSKGGTGL